MSSILFVIVGFLLASIVSGIFSIGAMFFYLPFYGLVPTLFIIGVQSFMVGWVIFQFYINILRREE